MQMAATIGKDVFYDYVSRFNFGAKTGVDLPGEEYGLIIKKDLVTDIDLATNSFGQNLNVTMVQEVAAFSSLINGGSYLSASPCQGDKERRRRDSVRE